MGPDGSKFILGVDRRQLEALLGLWLWEPHCPSVLQAAAQARQHFLITLISFPCRSLISKMQAVVMKPGTKQDKPLYPSYRGSASPPRLQDLLGACVAATHPPSPSIPPSEHSPASSTGCGERQTAHQPDDFHLPPKKTRQLGETSRVCFATFISCRLFLLMSRVLCPGTAAIPGISQPGARGCADKSGHEVYRS